VAQCATALSRSAYEQGYPPQSWRWHEVSVITSVGTLTQSSHCVGRVARLLLTVLDNPEGYRQTAGAPDRLPEIE